MSAKKLKAHVGLLERALAKVMCGTVPVIVLRLRLPEELHLIMCHRTDLHMRT